MAILIDYSPMMECPKCGKTIYGTDNAWSCRHCFTTGGRYKSNIVKRKKCEKK